MSGQELQPSLTEDDRLPLTVNLPPEAPVRVDSLASPLQLVAELRKSQDDQSPNLLKTSSDTKGALVGKEGGDGPATSGADEGGSPSQPGAKIGLEEQAARHEWAFTLYDLDGNGQVTKQDLAALMKSLYEAVGSSVKLPSRGSRTVKLRVSVSPPEEEEGGEKDEKTKLNNAVQPKVSNPARAEAAAAAVVSCRNDTRRSSCDAKPEMSERERELIALVERSLATALPPGSRVRHSGQVSATQQQSSPPQQPRRRHKGLHRTSSASNRDNCQQDSPARDQPQSRDAPGPRVTYESPDHAPPVVRRRQKHKCPQRHRSCASDIYHGQPPPASTPRPASLHLDLLRGEEHAASELARCASCRAERSARLGRSHSCREKEVELAAEKGVYEKEKGVYENVWGGRRRPSRQQAGENRQRSPLEGSHHYPQKREEHHHYYAQKREEHHHHYEGKRDEEQRRRKEGEPVRARGPQLAESEYAEIRQLKRSGGRPEGDYECVWDCVSPPPANYCHRQGGEGVDDGVEDHYARRHRHRERDRSLAMQQVADWLAREPVAERGRDGGLTVIHEHRHVHEHHHHHHHHCA